MKNNMQELQIKLPKACPGVSRETCRSTVKESMVLAFLEEHGLGVDFIKQHLSQFDRWIRFQEGTTVSKSTDPKAMSWN